MSSDTRMAAQVEPNLVGDWPHDVRRVRDLVMQYGWNATAYQIVNPGIRHWFTREGDGVIGYVVAAKTRVVAGAPVCAEERLGDITDEFERHAAAASHDVVYFGAEKRLEDRLSERTNYSMALLGAQPSWQPSTWLTTADSHSSLRAQFRRAENKAVVVEQWSSRRASGSQMLRAVLERWLSGRSLPPLHFLVEPATLERLDDRRVFVATRDSTIVAYAVLSPVPARNGWLVEQFPRIPEAPNGTVELLMRHAVQQISEDGAEYLTLGLAPLARRDGLPTASEPRWLRTILSAARVHGRRFYNFEGLEQFKSKFCPEIWEPIYAIQTRRKFSPRALYAIASAFASRSPVRLAGTILSRAVQQEIQWVAQTVTRR